MPSYGMDKLTWDTDETVDWLPKKPNARPLNLGRAIDRFNTFKFMGYSDEDAWREVYRFFPELNPDA